MKIKRHILTDEERRKGDYKRRLSPDEESGSMSLRAPLKQLERIKKRGGSAYIRMCENMYNDGVQEVPLIEPSDIDKLRDRINKIMEGGKGE